MVKSYWVYILHCSNRNFYTGYTTDLPRRYQEHVLGTIKCKYTRSFKPIGIAQSWRIDSSKSAVLKIEKYIKSLSRAEKEKLILHPQLLLQRYEGVLTLHVEETEPQERVYAP